MLTPYAYRFLKTQIEHSKSTKIVEFVDDLSALIQTVSGVIVTTSSRCPCAFNVSMMLPHRHIYAVRTYKALPLYDESLFAKRWTKNYLQISHRVFQDTQTGINVNTSGLPHITVISRNKTAKVKSQQDKYHESFALAQNLAQSVSECGTEEYTHRIGNMTMLKQLWEKRKSAFVTELIFNDGK